MTYSSRSYLERKTGAFGVGRFKYLQALVTEFQDSHQQEHRRQVLANLANFAYDPINYEFFRKLNILDLFLDILAEDTDDEMIEFAIGGICNCCLDELNKKFLTDNDGIKIVTRHLSSCNDETVLSSLTTLMYLTTSLTKKDTTTEYIVGTVKKLYKSSNKRLINLATIFIEDYCHLSTST